MQVRRDNFPAVFPHFTALLASCDFYAMDEEMTGINVPEVVESITFSPQESYDAKRRAASRYSIIQVGVCLFRRLPSTGCAGAPARYVAHPFNFLLFPQYTDDYTPSERAGDVVVSPSALAFLRGHGMDFQQWVYRGMAFCDASRETALRTRLEALSGAAASSSVGTAPLLTDAESAWVADAVRAAEALVTRVESAWTAATAEAALVGRRPFLASVLVDGGKEAVLPVQSSRAARESAELELRRRFPHLSIRSRRAESGGGRVMTLSVLSPEEVAKQRYTAAQKEGRQLPDALGFRLVFEELVRSKKPCVGHNCFADWLFLMHAMDGALPEQLLRWKERTRQLFPKMLDTRYIASRQDLFPRGRFSSISLGGLHDAYAGASPHCTVELPLGFEGYDPLTLLSSGGGGGPAHEAGYDALMTGTVLLNLLGELGHSLESVPTELCNKLALFRSLYALDVQSSDGDVYTPEAGVLDLRHASATKSYHVESCLATQDVTDVALYAVTDGRTLGVLPRPASAGMQVPVETIARRVTENCSRLLTASAYVPSHLSPTAPVGPGAAAATFPMPATGGGGGVGGGLRRSVQRLMSRAPASLLRRGRR